MTVTEIGAGRRDRKPRCVAGDFGNRYHRRSSLSRACWAGGRDALVTVTSFPRCVALFDGSTQDRLGWQEVVTVTENSEPFGVGMLRNPRSYWPRGRKLRTVRKNGLVTVTENIAHCTQDRLGFERDRRGFGNASTTQRRTLSKTPRCLEGSNARPDRVVPNSRNLRRVAGASKQGKTWKPCFRALKVTSFSNSSAICRRYCRIQPSVLGFCPSR